MENFTNAGPGLRKMFIAAIGTIICSVLAIIPIINIVAGIGSIVFGVLSIVGLFQAGKDIQGCMTAFYITIANLVLSIIRTFAGTGILGTILAICSTVLGLAVTYFVCTSVSETMNQIGAAAVAQKGHTVWVINLVCCIISVVITFLLLIPIINVIAAFASVIVAIVSLVGTILYMLFLNDGAKALGA